MLPRGWGTKRQLEGYGKLRSVRGTQQGEPACLCYFRNHLFWHRKINIAWHDLPWVTSPNSSILIAEHSSGCSGLSCYFSNHQCQPVPRTGAQRWSPVHDQSTWVSPIVPATRGLVFSSNQNPRAEGESIINASDRFPFLNPMGSSVLQPQGTHGPTSMLTFKREERNLFFLGLASHWALPMATAFLLCLAISVVKTISGWLLETLLTHLTSKTYFLTFINSLFLAW